MITTPALSAESLRFVRTCTDLSRAQAQHAMTLRQLPTRERHASELGNAAIAEHARETVAAWAFRVAELSGQVEAKPACCAHCGAVVKAPKPAKLAPVRDCRVRAMRRFWALAKAAGLDVKDAEGMTVALAKYLGCIIPSRADLSSGQWCEASAALELGLLSW